LASDGKFYLGNPEQALGQMRSGQIVGISEIEAVEAKVVMEEVLGLARPQYVLRNLCREVRMDQLVMSIDIATAPSGKEKVPEMQEAEIVRQAYSRQDFSLWKNVVHVVVSDEARLRSAHDVLRLHTTDAGNELARMENSQIQTLAETATGIAGTDWGTDTNNPYDDIGAAMDVVEAKYAVDFIAANPRVWLDFFSNDNVKGTNQPIQIPSGTSFAIPGLPNVQGYSDRVLTNTLAVVGSERAPALVLGVGPTESARYRNEPSGYDAYIIRQWLEPKLVLSDAIRKLTGVHV
jgi:hypothetical protein